MAKLSAHGTELFRERTAGYDKAYMSDGKILKNYGSGWKLAGRLKPGVDPVEHAARKRAYEENVTPDRVMRRAFRDRMIEEFGSLDTRTLAFRTICDMPEDPDGCWAMFDDFRPSHNVEIDTWVELCRLYKLAWNEGEAARAAKAAVAAA